MSVTIAGCSFHSAGNGSSTRASAISGPCVPSRIASMTSGASSVSRNTRVMLDGVIFSRSARSPIHNALTRRAGPVTVWIDGIAASAASYVAMAGDEMVMPENAFLVIHDPAGLVAGPAAEMRSMAEALDKIAATLAAGYAAKSGAEPPPSRR